MRAVASWLLQGLGRKVRLIVVNYTRGKAYNGDALLAQRKVTLSFPRSESGAYPIRFNYWHYTVFNKYPQYEARDELEACVVILAHEAYHFRQDKNGWRLRQKTCEVWAAEKLCEYREYMRVCESSERLVIAEQQVLIGRTAESIAVESNQKGA